MVERDISRGSTTENGWQVKVCYRVKIKLDLGRSPISYSRSWHNAIDVVRSIIVF